MNIKIKSLHMDLTDSMKTYVDKKLETLNKFTSDGAILEVELGKVNNHHKHGDVFKAELNFTSSGKLTRTEAVSDDLYSAIDIAHSDMLNTLSNKKDKKQTLWRKGASRIKEFARGLSKKKRK
jgi:ribosomal subunit interface protein